MSMTHAQARLDDGEGSFTTPSERKREAAARKRYHAAQERAEKALSAACVALNELMWAYFDVHPDAPSRADDGRRLLVESMAEYAVYIGSVKGGDR